MRKLTMRCLMALCALAAFALAMPSAAKTLYKWVAEDGTVSFTDDADRVPARYQAAATRVESKSLDDFERFSPTDEAAQADYRTRLDARLERLRALNAMLDGGHHLARTHPAERPGFEAVVEVNDTTSFRVPAQPGNDAPVIVEEVRVRRQGQDVTGHNTIVRQGDDVLMVVRPTQNQGPPSYDEEDYLER